MNRKDRIEAHLRTALSPEHLEVIDESDHHIGHTGYQEGGESHFHVRITAHTLGGQSRIAQHRKIHAAIGKDLMSEIHALSIDINAS